MAIMTKEEFKTESKKWWSRRDGTIGKIDNKLKEYHEAIKGTKAPDELFDLVLDLRDLVDSFAKEKEKKYKDTDSTQSTKRKNAVDELRKQVYKEMKRLRKEEAKIDKSELSKLQEAHVQPIGVDDLTQKALELQKKLQALKITKGSGKDNTNQLRSDLHNEITNFFSEGNKNAWENILTVNKDHDKDKYLAVKQYVSNIDGKYEPQFSLRVANVRLESLEKNQCEFVKFADPSNWDDAEKKAAGGMAFMGRLTGRYGSSYPPVEMFGDALRKKCATYIKALLTDDMAEELETVKSVLDGEDDYTAVVHLDFYANRPAGSDAFNALHKDTAGNTLFVALHYLNENPMLGPEYVDDPAPIKPTTADFNNGGKGYYADVFEDGEEIYHPGVEEIRTGAPWANISEDKYVWPEVLLDALQAARYDARKDIGQVEYIQDYKTMPSNGLIRFIDELIFHTTPIMWMREDEKDSKPEQLINSGVSIAGCGSDTGSGIKVFGERTYRTRLKRTLSTTFAQKDDHAPVSSGPGKRRFFRVWVAVVPKHWYETLSRVSYS